MSQQMSLERLIADWMADEAARLGPDQLVNQIITTTRRQRPRPRWLASIQESPMHAQARVVVGSPTRRLTFAVALLLLAALIAAGIAGAFLLRPQPAADDWPGFRGGPSRVGLATTGPIGNPVTQWTFHAGGGVRSAVAVSGDLVLFSSDDGVLHAVALSDGVEQWSFTGPRPLRSPLAINGRVYISDGQGFIHAFNLADGRLVWTSEAPVAGPSELGLLDDSLFVGTADGFVVSLQLSSGAERWRTKVSPAGLAVHAPAAADGLLVTATDDLEVTALDPENGEVRWSTTAGTEMIGTPIVAGGSVYIGAGLDQATGSMVALDAATGVERWRVDEPVSSPTISGGTGYASSGTGAIMALNLVTGDELWRTNLRGTIRAPAVAGDVVYVAADDAQTIAALDAATGGVLWTYEVDGPNDCCIAVARGQAFAGTLRGTVYAIAGDGAVLVPQVASTPSAAPTTAGSSAELPMPPLETSVIWATDTPAGADPWNLTLDPEGRLWSAGTSDDQFGIYTADGEYVESFGSSGSDPGQFKLQRANTDPYGAIEFAPDGSFYVLDPGNLRIQRFDADRQFIEMWGEFGTNPGQYQDPIGLAVDGDGVVYVLDNLRNVIEWYDDHGTVLGSVPAIPQELQPAGGANALTIGPNGNFFVSVFEPNVVLELGRDGALVRTFGGDPVASDLPAQANRVAFDAAGRLYVTLGPREETPGLLVFDPEGKYLGGFGLMGVGDADLFFPWGIVVTDDGIYIADPSGVEGGRSTIRKFEPITFP
jgi:eukaryotic-like serine/threonine-protein kinase